MKSEFTMRLTTRMNELKTLYLSLYPAHQQDFDRLLKMLERRYHDRSAELKRRDSAREADLGWYKSNQLLGICLYVDQFAGTLQGVCERLDYLRELGVNYLHLMPFLDTVDERSDGGYAVANFRKVKPELGTIGDLEKLTSLCHEQGISVCMDFVMNHTGEDHLWARKARAGDTEYKQYYYFYKDRTIPDEYEKHVPQVFPVTAPGNFTWLADAGEYVLTSFYPYQWDLNYGNPAVFQEMMKNLLFLANKGIDVIRIDAVPYIWKELGTDCRNLPQVHTIVRMLRLICEIVCPAVLLLGEVVMAPEKLAPYFGSVEFPECHMLYNATTMCTSWHTVATGDTRLLSHQIDTVAALPKDYIFLNYLRCHDDIGWGLDYSYLKQFGMEEIPHKAYLNSFFIGEYPRSFSRGELYNSDPKLGDARLCGTTASLLGIETAKLSGDSSKLDEAVARDVMLHAWLLSQSGVPILYAGDEIGQLNDYSYHLNPKKADDSRYVHRGAFCWDQADLRNNEDTPQGRLFQQIRQLVKIRRRYGVFSADAEVDTFDTGDQALLGVKRSRNGNVLIMVYNFSGEWRHTRLCANGSYIDVLRNETLVLDGTWNLPPYGFVWLLSE